MPKKTTYFFIVMGVLALAALVLPFPDNDGLFFKKDQIALTTGQNMAVHLDVNELEEGLPLRSVSEPANGTAAITGSHRLTYTPLVGFSGSDQFTYTVADPETNFIASRTVNVTVLDSEGLVIGGQLYAMAQLDFTQATHTVLTGINAQGQMIGTWWDETGTAHLLLTISPGHFETFVLPDTLWQQGQGINDQGVIVGTVQVEEQSLALIDDGQETTTLAAQDDAPTQAFDINNAGQMAGAVTDQTGQSRAFVRQPDGEITRLALPADLGQTWALGLNDAGQVVGAAETGSAQRLQGFVYHPDGRVEAIAPPGTTLSWAHDINTAGMVVGVVWDGQLTGVPQSLVASLQPGSPPAAYVLAYEAFLYHPDQGYQRFSLPGAIATQALGLNDAGQIVGLWIDSAGDTHGFILTQVADNADFINFVAEPVAG